MPAEDRAMRLLCSALIIVATVIAAEDGSLSGTVTFNGNAPQGQMIQIAPAKAAGCDHVKAIPDEALVVNPANKGLKWVIVRIMIEGDFEGGENLPPINLDQKGCVFSPHAFIVAPKQSVNVLNPDGIGHNFHTIPLNGDNVPVNIAIPAAVPALLVKGKKHFAIPEMIQFQCDIHGWMKGFIAVHDPRYAAVTDANGKFAIKNVPPGKYKVMFNHEQGEKELEVEIKAGAEAELNAAFGK
jgi:plastocyanin